MISNLPGILRSLFPDKKLTTALLLVVSQGPLGCCFAGAPTPVTHVAARQTMMDGGPALDLPGSLSLAIQRQPRVMAARASLAAAEDGKRAVDNLHVPTLIDPELPIRRKQAALGVAAAQAGVEQAEREAAYAVTRSFYSVIFAREQEKVAREVVERLAATNESARTALQGGARNVSSADVNRSTVYLNLARAQQIKAAQGVERALAALREAVGLGGDCLLSVSLGELPDLKTQVNRSEVVALAVARRAEIVQAGIFAEVVCLEVDAQGTGIHKRMETFAAGSDIHSRLVPQGEHNDTYRPGAVAPEMPTILAGNRAERVQHARSLHSRASAVAETARNLVALEAEDAFLRWEEASRQIAVSRDAVKSGDQLADELSKDFTSGLKVKVDEVINARVLASRARADLNEYLYKQILALADLERITSGAFCAGLIAPELTVAKPTAEAAK